jgi:hypothetical protein
VDSSLDEKRHWRTERRLASQCGQFDQASVVLRRAICVVVLASSSALLAATANAQEPACLPTAARVVDAAAFPGLMASPPAAVHTTPRAFVTEGGRVRIGRINRQHIRRLRREGFVSGISQVYQSTEPTSPFGFSIAIQLGSTGQAAADARRNRDFNLHFKGIPKDWKSFALPDVPGARGLRSRGRHVIANAYLSDGVYSYIVSLANRRVSDEVGLVRAAASSLYARVHGSTVCT